MLNSKPQLLAWHMCDSVHIDPQTQKHFIMGIFSGIHCPRLPTVHRSMTWFLALTDVQPGKHVLKISMSLEMQAPLTIIEREFESKSPVSRIYLINEIKNLTIEHAGDYNIEVEIDGEMLLLTSFQVSTAAK